MDIYDGEPFNFEMVYNGKYFCDSQHANESKQEKDTTFWLLNLNIYNIFFAQLFIRNLKYLRSGNSCSYRCTCTPWL